MHYTVLQTNIEFLKGVGPARADLLKKELNIHTYQDLLLHFPNRYLDRTKYYKIKELVANNPAEIQIIGIILQLKTVESNGKTRLVAIFSDETGTMELTWFQNYKWIKENLKINEPYVIFGKTKAFNGLFTMSHPDMELLSEHQKQYKPALQPIYPSTEKLPKKGITQKVLQRLVNQAMMESVETFSENFPVYMLSELQLISKKTALFNIHFPESAELLSQAQIRLKFEELFFLQLQLLQQNLIRKHKIKGHWFERVGENFMNFYENHLPFELTNAQKKVLKEIRIDLASKAQMNRLLQGDVGSGKTIVAFMSMLLAIDNGFQACLMAPTEILAQQHFESISDLAKNLHLNIKLLTGSSKTAHRKMIDEELQSGDLHIIIGTHSLLEDKIKFKNLGIAVIDEQHKFGVEQRYKLWKKNILPPHILVMTATPIPRTLAMSLYGDLDISVIDELPPGRKPIKTVHRFDSHRLSVWKFLKDEIAKGRQIYIVYPLIEGNETMSYKDLMEGYENVSRDFPLPQYSISIVHGKMKPQDKQYEMERFAQGKTDILIATTVIEVGVNVPNASVMVIESAERFGLSQLHQLRGRVGRGADQSFCILMTDVKLSSDGKTRMETMVRTNDGFEIAEVDLKLRGPGDLMGTQQSGILNLKIADIVKDKDLLIVARNYATKLLNEDTALQKPEHTRIKDEVAAQMQKKTVWNFIS